MKDKSQPGSQSNDISLKTSSANLFLNIIIILLGVVIIIMSYSLVTKLKTDSSKVSTGNKGKKADAIVQLEILNGCGVSGVAEIFTDYLRKNNFDVVQIGNYRTFDIDKSMVIDRTGNKADAEKVAESLGIEKKNIIQQINYDYFLDVSVIVGRDFNKLKPYK